MIQGSVQEVITTANVHAPSVGAPPYIRQLPAPIKWEAEQHDNNGGLLTPHLHQWTDYPDRKSMGKHRH